jgi:hypothetical protein
MRCEQVRPGGGRRRVHTARSDRGAVDCSLMTLVTPGLDPSGNADYRAPRRAPSGAGDHEHCCRAVSGAQPAARPATLLTDRLPKISRHLEDGHLPEARRQSHEVCSSVDIRARCDHSIYGGEKAGMRRGVAYRGPSGWVLTRLTCVFRLNRVACRWPGWGHRSSSGSPPPSGNDGEDRTRATLGWTADRLQQRHGASPYR